MALLSALLLCRSNVACGQASNGNSVSNPALPGNAQQLVQQVIQNELKEEAAPQPHFEYRERKQTPGGSVTTEVVETEEGDIGRVIARNDAPLTADQQRKETRRMQKLVNDSRALEKRRKSEQEDEERTRRMISALPAAFLYQYDGAEDSLFGTLVRLRFSPNPKFSPPSRETQVYRGMQGTLLVSPRDRRLVEINATLFQQVNFGWGIFGRLNPGGHFLVRQSRISPTRWESTEMDLSFTGRILLFKRLKIDERDTECDFQPITQSLTLKLGAELLERQAPELAQSLSSAKPAPRNR